MSNSECHDDFDSALGDILMAGAPKQGLFLPKGVKWADVWRAVADLQSGRRPTPPKGIDDANWFDILTRIFQAIPLLIPFLKVLADIFGPKPEPNPTPAP